MDLPTIGNGHHYGDAKKLFAHEVVESANADRHIATYHDMNKHSW
jgi:hypothetical protein